MIVAYLGGASIALSFVVALLFQRAYRRTSDRLFVWFAVAFFVLGVQAVVTASLVGTSGVALTFALRIAAFGTILAGIYDRNRR